MSYQDYKISQEDVENVLHANAVHVADSQGNSFQIMADNIFDSLDTGLIEKSVLYGNDLNEQTGLANEEIARQLRVLGVLEPLKNASTTTYGRH